MKFNGMTFGQWVRNILIATDQWFNALLWGDVDETISSRIGKHVHWKGDTGWRLWLSKFLDLFDSNHTLNHIEEDEGKKRGD